MSNSFNENSPDAMWARILARLDYQDDMDIRREAEAQEFRSTLLDQVIQVKAQTTKTNGRLTEQERITQSIEKVIKVDCIKWSSIFNVKNWRIYLILIGVGFGSKIGTIASDMIVKFFQQLYLLHP